MKTKKISIKKYLFILIGLITVFNIANAQDSKKEKQAGKMIITKDFIDSQRFIFVPQFVSPLRGGTRPVTSYYDLQITKDSLISYLPYFGRAYTAPLNSADVGFNFTSTNFDYKATPGKKESWNILIKPKNTVNVQQLSLSVFSNASATLSITGPDRDAISYRGYITTRDQNR